MQLITINCITSLNKIQNMIRYITTILNHEINTGGFNEMINT